LQRLLLLLLLLLLQCRPALLTTPAADTIRI
jgi:hypothetical protein